MNKFLQLNRQKLKPAFVRISLIPTGIVFILFFTVFLMTGNFPSVQLLLGMLLLTCFGFPAFLMLLGYLGWLLNHEARQSAFSKKPFNQIENIGFYKTYKGDISKWTFTDELKEGNVNGFTIRMDLSKEYGSRMIEFDIPVEWKKLDKSEFNRLSEKFKEHNAELRIGSVVKHYDTRKIMPQTVSDLKLDLELFTEILRQEGFKAKA